MKSISTANLAGLELLQAVADAVKHSYSLFRAELNKRSADDLVREATEKYPTLMVWLGDFGSDMPPKAALIRLLASQQHEPLLADEETSGTGPEYSDLWPLAEHLVLRYAINVNSVRTDGVVTHWRADAAGFGLEGKTPCEAIMRYYVALKLGDVVHLWD